MKRGRRKTKTGTNLSPTVRLGRKKAESVRRKELEEIDIRT